MRDRDALPSRRQPTRHVDIFDADACNDVELELSHLPADPNQHTGRIEVLEGLPDNPQRDVFVVPVVPEHIERFSYLYFESIFDLEQNRGQRR